MAVKDEETGIAYYKALSEATNDDDLKDICMALALQEEIHAGHFRKMLDEIGMEKPKKEDYDGQYEKYLNYLLTSRAFPTPEEAAKRAGELANDKAGIKIAMEMEKDALIFYDEIRKLIPDTHINYVEAIIDEERKHLQDLDAILKAM